MSRKKSHFVKRNAQRGQGMIEYAFILILVAVVAIVGVAYLGGAVNNSYCKVNNAFAGSPPASCPSASLPTNYTMTVTSGTVFQETYPNSTPSTVTLPAGITLTNNTDPVCGDSNQYCIKAYGNAIEYSTTGVNGTYTTDHTGNNSWVMTTPSTLACSYDASYTNGPLVSKLHCCI